MYFYFPTFSCPAHVASFCNVGPASCGLATIYIVIFLQNVLYCCCVDFGFDQYFSQRGEEE